MRSLITIVHIIFYIFPSLCLSSENTPPGCMKQIGLGGCMGKSRIESIAVAPELTCLHLYANNCNGGVLTIQNKCNYPLKLGEIKIDVNAVAPNDSIELYRNFSGAVKAKYSTGNYASYFPINDDNLLIDGVIGNVTVHLQYVKTKPLCD